MKAEKPAQGILKTGDWGDCKMYQVVCGCGNPDHNHNVEVEADTTGVNVHIYTTVSTKHWEEPLAPRNDIDNEVLQEAEWFAKGLINGIIRRIKLTWEVWTTGAVRTETTIALTQQQAVNYAETLKSAIQDVEDFRDEQRKGTTV